MAIGPRLEFRQTQSLVMTPQLRQAIKLLQFSNLEAAAYVEQELERNPLLERDERPDFPGERPEEPPPPPAAADSAELVARDTLPAESAAPLDAEWDGYEASGAADGMPERFGRTGSGGFDTPDRGPEDMAEARTSLRDHLGEQLRLTFHDRTDRLIGAHLIALLDGAGRVLVSDQDLAAALGTTPARVAAVRGRMMRFDPVGLFAPDLRTCLAAQLAERNRLDPAMAALLDHLDLLARHEYRRLGALCEVDWADLQDMIAELRALDPKPGAGWDAAPLLPVIPDVLMRAAPNGDWILELNPDTMPRVLVNLSFHARVHRRGAREEKSFLAENLASANWLVKSLQQRAQTILKVASEIVRQQEGFFRHGVAHLRPLILRDIAEAVEMHESTVSRVTANKYIATPRGTFELKYFFTTAIAGTSGEAHSAEAVRHRIRELILHESPDSVLSDDAIVAALRAEGVDIARRTVAKYREALRIPSSVQRKREKAVPA
jgi:RNA polymerase sigma-54 factor